MITEITNDNYTTQEKLQILADAAKQDIHQQLIQMWQQSYTLLMKTGMRLMLHLKNIYLNSDSLP